MTQQKITLQLRSKLELSLDTPCISPTIFLNKTLQQIEKLTVFYGKEQRDLGDFFSVTGKPSDTLEDMHILVIGTLDRVKSLGSRMTGGFLEIQGNAGMYTGSHMQGGKILVHGDVDNYAGVEITGGILEIQGSTGHFSGGALYGNRIGMNGGWIIIHGNAGDHLGQFMRRGVIYVDGYSGEFTGNGMTAGTIIVNGKIGSRVGANMIRGTIISFDKLPTLLPTFLFEGQYSLNFLRLTFHSLKERGISISDKLIDGEYIKFRGDRSEEEGRGEIYLLSEKNLELGEAR